LLKGSDILADEISWDEKDYILYYETSSETTKLKIELENVFDLDNLLTVKLYDKNNIEISNTINSYVFEINPKEVGRIVVTYIYGTENIPRTALDLLLVGKTVIDEISVSKLSFEGSVSNVKLIRGGNIADYVLSDEFHGIVTGFDIKLKSEFSSLGYMIKVVTEEGEVFDCLNQQNNSLVYIEIYNGIELLERKSVLILYEFEFETIKDNILAVLGEEYYYSVTCSDNSKLYIDETNVYRLLGGKLEIVDCYFSYEDKYAVYNIENICYTSFKDDETGNFNILGSKMVSKNPVMLYGGNYYEIYDENYNKTGELAKIECGLLKIYKVFMFEQNGNDEFIKYYFVSDKVILNEELSVSIYIEDSLGLMVSLFDDINQFEIKIPIGSLSENTYFVKDKINLVIK